jgi:hypothetical protein
MPTLVQACALMCVQHASIYFTEAPVNGDIFVCSVSSVVYVADFGFCIDVPSAHRTGLAAAPPAPASPGMSGEPLHFGRPDRQRPRPRYGIISTHQSEQHPRSERCLVVRLWVRGLRHAHLDVGSRPSILQPQDSPTVLQHIGWGAIKIQ